MGLKKLISTLVLSGGWSPSIDAFICFKDLANVAAIFSVEAQIYPIFLPGCSGVISDVLTPWKRLIFSLQMDRTSHIFHIHVHICIYIFIIKFAHLFWKSYKTSVVSHGLHVLNLVSLEVPLPHCNAFGLCPQILFLSWVSAAMWRRCDVTDGVGWLAASVLID